jgi:hypothetical protein
LGPDRKVDREQKDEKGFRPPRHYLNRCGNRHEVHVHGLLHLHDASRCGRAQLHGKQRSVISSLSFLFFVTLSHCLEYNPFSLPR